MPVVYKGDEWGFVELEDLELLESRPYWRTVPSTYFYELTREVRRLRIFCETDAHFFAGELNERDEDKFPNWKDLNRINKKRYRYERPQKQSSKTFTEDLAKFKAEKYAGGNVDETTLPDGVIIDHDDDEAEVVMDGVVEVDKAPPKKRRRKGRAKTA